MDAKVTNPFAIYRLIMAIFLTVSIIQSPAQDSGFVRPPVTTIWKEYRQQLLHDSTKKMIELKSLIPGLVYDLRYASNNNFMHRLLYPRETRHTYLRYPAAIALAQVAEELNKQGYGLKIFDAYRPYAVTVKFWELVRDERYVANPAKGSGHNRGIAVDLTIIDLASGMELDMGTGFDNFSDTAHHGFQHLSDAVKSNRQLLKSLMEKYGFVALQTEWWHFYLANGNRFEILDLSFNRLRKGR